MLDPLIDFLKAVWAWIASLPRRDLPQSGASSCRDRQCGRTARSAATAMSGGRRRCSSSSSSFSTSGRSSGTPRGSGATTSAIPRRSLREQVLEPAANDTTVAQQGAAGTRTCARSQMVDMQIDLIDFLVNRNAWIAAMPQYKLGFFGIPWQATPFLDNKEAFQHGVLFALRRTAVELSDQIGRVRGTSEADLDLQNARGSLQYQFRDLVDQPVRPVAAVRAGAAGSERLPQRHIPLRDLQHAAGEMRSGARCARRQSALVPRPYLQRSRLDHRRPRAGVRSARATIRSRTNTLPEKATTAAGSTSAPTTSSTTRPG